MGKAKTTTVKVWDGAATFTLEQTQPSEYDVYYNGNVVAKVYGAETSTDKMSASGTYIAWSTKPRKKWGFTMAGDNSIRMGSRYFLPTRKAALEWVADILDNDGKM